MNRRDLFAASLGASVAAAQTSTAIRLPGLTSVETIADLKALDPTTIHNDQFVVVEGFDASADGCGGTFFWRPEVLSSTLDGVAMNSSVSGSWHRHFEGPVHTRWAGIKPNATPLSFDPDGLGPQNRLRWNALDQYCRRTLWELLTPSKANVVVGTIFVDSGVHDFSGGTIHVGQGVGMEGTGPGRSVLRSNASSGVFVQVGSPGPISDDSSLESAFDIVKNLSIVHFSQASTGSDVGIAFDNTVRRSELSNVHVQGFGVNADLNAFGMDVRHCFFSHGYRTNLRIGPLANSMMIVGCRIDDQRWMNGGEGVLVDHTGGARNILFQRCDIQRCQRVAFRSLDVASLALRDCFFEGNNRDDGFHPDVWIGGESVRNVVIDGCYFTGTGRFGGTTSRAINIRDDVTSSARIQITNNQQADSLEGTFANFIDIDANKELQLVRFNNLQNAGDSIPAAVIVKTVS